MNTTTAISYAYDSILTWGQLYSTSTILFTIRTLQVQLKSIKKQSLFSKVNNQMGKEMESVSSLLEEMKANQIDLEDLPEW